MRLRSQSMPNLPQLVQKYPRPRLGSPSFIRRSAHNLEAAHSWGFIHYAYSLHTLERTKEAYGVLIPVVDKFNEHIIRYNLACYSCQLGNLKESRQWLEKAIELCGKKDIRTMALNDPDLEPLWKEIGQV